MDGIQLDSDLVVDYADLVFFDDCMDAVKRLARSIEVDEPTLTLRVCYFLLERTSWEEEVQGMLTEVEQTHETLSRRNPEEAGGVRRGFLNSCLERIRNKF